MDESDIALLGCSQGGLVSTMVASRIPGRISRAYGLVARRADPYDFMGNYRGPVLLVHGDADPIVPIAYSERALRTFDDARFARSFLAEDEWPHDQGHASGER